MFLGLAQTRTWSFHVSAIGNVLCAMYSLLFQDWHLVPNCLIYPYLVTCGIWIVSNWLEFGLKKQYIMYAYSNMHNALCMRSRRDF